MMSSKASAPLIWRVTLLLATVIGRCSAFSFPTRQIISPSLKVPCIRVLPLRCLNNNRSIYSLPLASCKDTGSEVVEKSKKHNMKAYDLPLIQSISFAVASRRLSFLVLSIFLVNFVRSKILKVRAVPSENFLLQIYLISRLFCHDLDSEE